MSVLSQISNCQGLGRKNKFENLKTDRTEALCQLKKKQLVLLSKCIQDGIVLISLFLDLNWRKLRSGAGFTSMNTKAGDLLNLNFRDCADQNNANVPVRVYCCLYYECVVSIKDSRVEIIY